jgi:hypothetical protein
MLSLASRLRRPEKTTATILTLRGGGAKDHHRIRESGGVGIAIGGILTQLPTVESYKHVGIAIAEGNICAPDVAVKSAALLATALACIRYILRSDMIELPIRVALADSLVVTQGEFGSGMWPQLTTREMALYHRAIVKGGP